ncbi:MAG: TlpA family protein disulfide reductase, partial [Planctomycetes bacterium]|nr:TlpA family protein disulfide reductase [Planctomycetota bacterium]
RIPRMRSSSFLLLLSAWFFPSSLNAEPPKDEIKLVKIKADEVLKMIAQHQGKVVVVDVWGEFCAPCKKKFPHLVQLHKDLAKEGLVCISLSVDLEENFDGALEFLRKHGATFPNYILWDNDDNKDELEKKLAQRSPPIIHVFNRKGEKVHTWEGRIKEDEIDKLIKELLQEKK